MNGSKQLLALAVVIAATLMVSTLGACATWGDSRPDSKARPPAITTTVYNNHGHELTAGVSVNGSDRALGILQSGERRTFRLPRDLATGSTYYLFADCPTGRRIVSEPISTAAAVRPWFMVGQDDLTSFVRHVRASSDAHR